MSEVIRKRLFKAALVLLNEKKDLKNKASSGKFEWNVRDWRSIEERKNGGNLKWWKQTRRCDPFFKSPKRHWNRIHCTVLTEYQIMS